MFDLQIKYEWWWLYVSDKKNHLLITAPVQVCSLRTEEEVNIFMNEKKVSMNRKSIV